jgi:hypothetical protein
MVPRLVTVEHVRDYRIRVAFEDGASGEIDLEPELWGEVFEPLRDPETFRSFTLDEALNTITWSTGADLAPEFLYDSVVIDRAGTGRGSRMK